MRSPGQIEMVSLGLAIARVAEGGALTYSPRPARAGTRYSPDVPTTAELGLPDVRMDTWFGLSARPACPKAGRRTAGARERRGGERSRRSSEKLFKIGCDVDFMPRRGVHRLHPRHQEMARAHPGDGHPVD